jgi:hypothetical protein
MKAIEGKEIIFWGQEWMRKGGTGRPFLLNNKPGYRGSTNYELVGSDGTIKLPTEYALRADFKPITFSLDEQ